MSDKIIAIGDIHGQFDLLEKLIDYHGQDSNYLFLGDYIDRGECSKEVMDFVISLKNKICLIGNHEEFFISYLKYYDISKIDNSEINMWLHPANGGLITLKSLNLPLKSGWSDLNKKYQDFLNSLVYYHETENEIFVHAGIDPTINKMAQQDNSILLWTRKNWISKMQDWPGKKVIFGHTTSLHYTNYLSSRGLYEADNALGIDTAAYITGILTSVVIEDGEYKIYQYKKALNKVVINNK